MLSTKTSRIVGLASQVRHLHSTAASLRPASSGTVPDALAGTDARGRTGGGPELSSSQNPPPKPKITNQSIPGSDGTKNMTEEQKKEVEQHNKEFDKKHDRGEKAEADKVDKKFWSGGAENSK